MGALVQNPQIVLARRPVGAVKAGDLALQMGTKPALMPGQLRVKNHFLSLDPAIRYWLNETATYMPGVAIGEAVRCFAAGEVVESSHSDWRVGEWVTGLLGAQQFAVSDGVGLVRCDLAHGSLSAHLGVLGMPGMTAYFGLLNKAQPQPGDVIFVSGAAGVVGTAVGQIARIQGCQVVGSAGSDEKCQNLVQAGFSAAFNYKTETTDAALKRLCPQGVNVYFDNVGGDTLDGALLNLARGARVVICGALSQYNHGSYAGPKNYMKLLTARATLSGLIVFDYQDRWPQAVDQMAAWLRDGRLSTHESITHGIETFPTALAQLYQGTHFGKVLVAL